MVFQVHLPNDAPLGTTGEEKGSSRLANGRQIIRAEAAALELVAQRLDDSFLQAVDLLQRLTGRGAGRVCVTGTGKSADVGQKIAGTLSSTGTRAYVLDATRAMHGDLGMVHPDDVALILSHSGESEEIVRLLGHLRPLVRGIIALTGNARRHAGPQSGRGHRLRAAGRSVSARTGAQRQHHGHDRPGRRPRLRPQPGTRLHP